MTNDGFKRDYLFLCIAVILLAASLIMLVAGIWLDGRWFFTGIIGLIVGCWCGFISSRLDQRYRDRGIRE